MYMETYQIPNELPKAPIALVLNRSDAIIRDAFVYDIMDHTDAFEYISLIVERSCPEGPLRAQPEDIEYCMNKYVAVKFPGPELYCDHSVFYQTCHDLLNLACRVSDELLRPMAMNVGREPIFNTKIMYGGQQLMILAR